MLEFFGIQGEKPAVYYIGEIYDPQIHTTPTAAEGKIVPCVKSIVIDDRSIPGKNVLMVVESIDSVTLAATLVPADFVRGVEDDGINLVNYGNDTLKMYYDDRVTPVRLMCDNKFGNYSSICVEYRIVKKVNGESIPISALLDTEGAFVTDRIPFTTHNNIHAPGPCHTLSSITDNEVVYVEIFDTTGTMILSLAYTTLRATILNDYNSSINPIISMAITANQIQGDNWAVYVGQDPEELDVFAVINYANGDRVTLPIDNIDTHIYGLDAIDNTQVNSEFNVIVKHFLQDTASVGPTPQLLTDGNKRFLVAEKTVKVIPRSTDGISKLMPIPLMVNGLYQLKYAAYFDGRDRFELIPIDGVTWDSNPFVGDQTTVTQELIVSLTIPNGGDPIEHSQHFAIKMNALPTNVPWVISETKDDVLKYGSDTASYNRPVLWYDSAIEKYFVPTSEFTTYTKFLQAFYYMAYPPYVMGVELSPVEPTHFAIRDADSGQSKTSAPIPIDTYDQSTTLITPLGSADYYKDKTVIVEFLQQVGENFNILFGVPVEVKAGTYNT